MVKCFWAKRETKYFGFVVESGNVRTSQSKVAPIKDGPLSETQNQVKFLIVFCSFYREFIHQFADCSAPFTDLYRKSLPGRVVHSDIVYQGCFRDPKGENDICPCAPDSQIWPRRRICCCENASKVGIAGVLLQEDFDGHLRPCVYWARKVKDAETRYIAYDKESLAIVEVVSRVRRMYLLG
jgi:hypothetical protein